MTQTSKNNISILDYEKVFVKYLFTNETVRDKIYPYLSTTFFNDIEIQEIIKKSISFYQSYNKFPSASEMTIFTKDENVNSKLLEILNFDTTDFSDEFILKEISDFCKKKLIVNQCIETVENIKNDELKKAEEAPDKIREALAFSFDTSIGTDFLNSAEDFYDYLHFNEKIIPTGLSALDEMIDGGWHEKALHMILGGTNIGKTLFKCSFATNALLQNKNVLYITLEMSEKRIAQRIAANMFDININELKLVTKDKLLNRFEQNRTKIKSNLVIKEFPPTIFNSNHLRNLIKELNLKRGFVPDIMFIDYLGIMAASKSNKSDNTYVTQKRISEEVRAVTVETSIPIISSTQTNREGLKSDHLEMTDVSDSIGVPFTVDLLLGITEPEEFRKVGRYVVNILKSRFGERYLKCYCQVDKPKMRISDVSNAAPKEMSKKEIENAAKELGELMDKEMQDDISKMIG